MKTGMAEKKTRGKAKKKLQRIAVGGILFIGYMDIKTGTMTEAMATCKGLQAYPAERYANRLLCRILVNTPYEISELSSKEAELLSGAEASFVEHLKTATEELIADSFLEKHSLSV